MSERGFARILAFDCSGASCSAAVLVEGRILAERLTAMQRGQAEALLPQIRDVMAAAELDFDDLDVLATTVGPGSFTGLRIGLAAARGLALAAGKPILALTSFEAHYAAAPESLAEATVAVAIDSRRGSLFVQLFAPGGTPSGEPVSVEPAAFSALLPSGPVSVLGDGSGALEGLVGPEVSLPLVAEPIRAAAVARAAARLGPAGIERLAPLPHYLRAPDATPAGSPR